MLLDEFGFAEERENMKITEKMYENHNKQWLLGYLVQTYSEMAIGFDVESLLKFSKEQLIKEIVRIKTEYYNGVCTVYYPNHKQVVYKCRIDNEKRVIHMESGETMIIEFNQEYIENQNERLVEGNSLNAEEEKIYKEIN